MESEKFESIWNLAEDWIEEPNIRRKGISGVIRTTFDHKIVYVKKQTNHFHYSLRHPFGRATAQREAEAITAVKLLGITVPNVLYIKTKKVGNEQRTLMVTSELHNYLPLEDFVTQDIKCDERENVMLMRALARTLVILHRNRWQHSCLNAKHIFACRKGGGFQVALIDLEKMRRRLSIHKASKHDLDQLSRHQKCWSEESWAQFLSEYRRELYLKPAYRCHDRRDEKRLLIDGSI